MGEIKIMEAAFFGIGGLLIFTSVVGKGSIRFYNSVKTGNAFSSSGRALGQYYRGGFEGDMTRREAGLILGVRESSEEVKIIVAHRALSRANHPDLGGSTYLSTKVNQAKE